MKTVIASFLALAMITPSAVFARPGDWGPGPHWYRPGQAGMVLRHAGMVLTISTFCHWRQRRF